MKALFFFFTFPLIISSAVGRSQLTILQQPSNSVVCVGSSVQFIVSTSGNVSAYQWEVSTDNGTSWTPITASGVNPFYSGWSTNSLSVSNVSANNNGYRFRCNVIGGSTQITQTFTSPGPGNWTCPQGVASVTVQCWGGGGAGGGQNPANYNFGGGGGGGGAFASSNLNLVPGTTYNYSIGSGGGGSFNTGQNGNDTYWSINVVLAKGGAGGEKATPSSLNWGGAGGLGGQANQSIGSIKFSGGNGFKGQGTGLTPYSGGGGGGAGTNSDGSHGYYAGGNGGGALGGKGGDGHFGCNGCAGCHTGGNGLSFGGGGGGARENGSCGGTGGNGANGALRLIYNAPQTTYSNHAILTVNPNPQVTISNVSPTTFCSGGSVQLVSMGATNYLWNTNQNGNSISASQTGTYSVIGTDANGCSDTSNAIQVTVNPNPQVTISSNGSTSFCQGNSVILQASGASNYQWNTNQSGNAISASQTGTYSVIGTDANGCSNTSNAIQVTVNPNPQVTISSNGSTNLCQGNSIILQASGATNYLWNTNQSGNAISASQSGTYSVIGTDANGCSNASNAIQVVVNPNPQVTISSNGSTSFCQGNSVILQASGASNYLWNTNQSGNSISASQTGTYSVIGTDANGCSDTSNAIQVTVNSLPQLSINILGEETICEGDSTLIVGTTNISHQWSNGETTDSIWVNSSGTYSYTGTDSNGCSSVSNAVNITVVNLPIINSQPQNLQLQSNQTANFSVLTQNPTDTYQWQSDVGFGFQNLNNVGQYSGVTTNTLTVSSVSLSNNNQPFRCIITSGSCSDTSQVAILTVNNNMDTENWSNAGLVVYPNPAQDHMVIKVNPSWIGSSYSIMDAAGRTLLHGQLNALEETISLKTFSPGMYLIKVGDKFQQYLRVIKE